ncbi:DNA translocase FtsK [Lacticaseibacillus sp. N501-2]|uniref:DNA translocase FtsK n=1 Tax=Lacticaseibacillus salsurae TaxID=3367729 RepID=UPI0038B29DF8
MPQPEPVAESEIGRHSVDPLAALSTPKSTVRRGPKRPQIDYQVILADMARPDDQVYLFVDDTNDAATSTPVVEPTGTMPDVPASQSANDPLQADETKAATPQVPETSAIALDATDLVPGASPDTAGESSEATQTQMPTTSPKTSVDHKVPGAAASEAQHITRKLPSEPAKTAKPIPTVSQTPTKLIPSQVDPLKAAQQAQLEAALAKQKKTVYANWRPLQLPKRQDLHSAVGNYKARKKDLPKPIAQMRAEQAQAKAKPTQPTARSEDPKLTTSVPQPTADSVAKPTSVAAPTPSTPAAQPSATSVKAEATPQQPYVFPPLDLLPKPVITTSAAQNDWVEAQAQRLDETLEAFHVGAHVVAHTIGPTVTQFQVSLDAGVKVNKITNLNDDLKLALAAKDIRIEAPIPGKTTVGIEIPNLHPRPVMLREVLQSPAFQDATSPLTIALGVDLFGQPVVTNINKMPHGLIAGATGSGKSVFINSLLTSLLYKATPEQVRLLLIDPKAVELAVYNNLPHLVSPVISDPKAAAEALKWAVEEMENRYQKMAAAGVRNLAQFNRKAKSHGDFGLVLPYVVIIIDELADLMMVAASEVQDYIARITQKARAAGIHLIVATQRPSVDVITGTIKNNIPTRIAFMVASQTDSRTIIDANGAERLLGRGDMLYLGNGASQALRLQGTFIDEDIATVVDFVKKERPAHYLFQPDGLLAQAEASDSQDELFPQVLEYIAQEKHVSTSKLQRVFSIGYNRAANLIDELEMRHYISPANGSKPRDVYFTKEDLADD